MPDERFEVVDRLDKVFIHPVLGCDRVLPAVVEYCEVYSYAPPAPLEPLRNSPCIVNVLGLRSAPLPLPSA